MRHALASFSPRLLRVLLLAVLHAGAVSSPGAAAASPEFPVSLSQAIGLEIDADERSRYGLFPDIPGFESGRFDSAGASYRLSYSERRDTGLRTRRRSVAADALHQTRWHVAFAEEYERLASVPAVAEPPSEADLMHRLALRYASHKEYQVAWTIATDLRDSHAGDAAGQWAAEALPRLEALAGPRRALIWPGSLLDQRGRTDLLVFSGYYGLWLGVAIPIAFEAKDAQAYAAGLLVAPTASVLLASNLTRHAPVSQGQATIIALGGHLGALQGMGWAGLGDADGNEVAAFGVGAGLGGILLAVPISNAVGFSEGHAAITSSAMYWGGWFGLVESVLTGRDGEDENSPLLDMLVGSDVGVLAAGIAAHDARVSKARMRLINLCGILGTAFGGGIALLTETDDDKAALALLGAGSVAGLAIGIQATRSHDRGRDLAVRENGPALEPLLGVRSGGGGRAAVPAAGLRVTF